MGVVVGCTISFSFETQIINYPLNFHKESVAGALQDSRRISFKICFGGIPPRERQINMNSSFI